MAQPYVTGAAHVFIGAPGLAGLVGTLPQFPGTPVAPVYLGTCERSPRIAKRNYYRPIFNSLAGIDVAYDRTYQGQDAFVMLPNINRRNEQVYQLLDSLPRQAGQVNGPTGIPQGYTALSDVGTAMITEGMTFPLYIVFPYFAKAVYANNGMLPGYRFLAAQLDSPDEHDNLNTEADNRRLIFYCSRLLLGAPSPVGGSAGWCLFDHYFGNMPANMPPN